MKNCFRVTMHSDYDEDGNPIKEVVRDIKADCAYVDQHGNLCLEDREVVNGAFITFPRLIVRDVNWKQIEPIKGD